MGILLAFSGCTAAGFLKAAETRRRKELLEDFKTLILHISTEISYFKEPLPQIFQRLAAQAHSEETTLLLTNWLTAYHTETASIDSLWTQAVDFAYADLPVTEEDLKILKKCGAFLGQSDFKGQQEHFDLLNTQLDRQIQQAADIAATKGKMYSRMGLSIGMVVAIVFI